MKDVYREGADLRCLRRCPQLLTNQYLFIVEALAPQMNVSIYLKWLALTGPRAYAPVGRITAQTPAISDHAAGR